ncbi:DUF86 domain-containing protein [Cellulomonas sp. zg-ZUI222]|uniref:DUF86 domain-containing protein n=1 Tax=Cellulomonas wangleii TaxID=2816956 RepID=A0ABX8D0D4_9CELL|nr:MULTISPECIES: HepT-like ribonuclease domain-containing protein [Cellulomonas]MBO0900161.1 DUF86 domain-containing protein [Cellulomonas sp. zg-ZUI22]MBO0920924.1 DUF86 domain-containing protein [Cellulomonas wangleii]MBO0925595.1 DUF86 domain-containing protein [Cellulomonas wangleii]QVI60943.1 DUF86 domain-containing protein [Cellulomonas wangleii]
MRPDVLFVAEMIDAATRIVTLSADRDAHAVDQDATVREALLWNFTVLGEAAKQVSQETRERHPDVPWRRAAGLRNRIVHGYWSTDTDVLVSTAHDVIPALLVQLTRVQDSLG